MRTTDLSKQIIMRKLFWDFKVSINKSFPGGTNGKESVCQHRRQKRRGFSPWARKVSRTGKQHPAPVFLLGKFHGQKSLVGYSSWGHKELDMTEHKYVYEIIKHSFLKYHKILVPIANEWNWMALREYLLTLRWYSFMLGMKLLKELIFLR